MSRAAAFLAPASCPGSAPCAAERPRAGAQARVQPRSAQTPPTKPTRASVWARKEAAQEPLAPSPVPASGYEMSRLLLGASSSGSVLLRSKGLAERCCARQNNSLSEAVRVGEKVNDANEKVNKPLGLADSPKHRGASRLRSSDTPGARCRSRSAHRSPRGRQGEGLGAPRSPRCPQRADLSVPWSPAGSQHGGSEQHGDGGMADTAFGCSASRGARAAAQPGPGRSAASSKAHAEIPRVFFNGCFPSSPSTL